MKTGYSLGATDGIPSIKKAPAAVLDYPFNWEEWLGPNETIASASASVSPSGLTLLSNNLDLSSKIVIVWLSGGVLNSTYRVSVTIHTSESRDETRSIDVKILAR